MERDVNKVKHVGPKLLIKMFSDYCPPVDIIKTNYYKTSKYRYQYAFLHICSGHRSIVNTKLSITKSVFLLAEGFIATTFLIPQKGSVAFFHSEPVHEPF